MGFLSQKPLKSLNNWNLQKRSRLFRHFDACENLNAVYGGRVTTLLPRRTGATRARVLRFPRIDARDSHLP